MEQNKGTPIIPDNIPEEVRKKMQEFADQQEAGRREIARIASLRGQQSRTERVSALSEQHRKGSAVIKEEKEE